MRKSRRLFTLLLALALVMSIGVPAYAAEGGRTREEYTYTVRFWAGGQGSFGGESVIEYTGLKIGDQVSFTNDMVTLFNGDKYYVRGIREAGKDNNTVAHSSFPVEGDADYVVAYGILGEAVAYTINYQDEEGNPLQPDDGRGNLLPSSETYYGNVGDRVIVSYRQVVGYEPQAYNLSKTLSENAAENVFTFVYTEITEAPAPEGPGPATDETEEGGEGGEEGTEIPDDQVPLDNGPQQIVDLDEDDTPKGLLEMGQNLVENGAELLNGLPFGARIGLIGLDALVIALVIWLIIYRKRKKKEDEAET